MLAEIKKFMQSEDPSGGWEDETELGIMYDTLNHWIDGDYWIDGGLKETPQITEYLGWLRTEFTGGLW